jgi:transglutaminase-like putative cysteine protease
VQLLGRRCDYELTLEPSRLPLLPMLELTPDRPGAAPDLDGWTLALRADVQWQVDRPVTERLRVRARAWPAHRHGPRSDVPGLRDYVALPPGFNPRALAWAAALRERPELARPTRRRWRRRCFEHIRRQGYTYTLEPGPYGRDAVDEFWFDRKLGFCEHFAVAFVVMMRALGVPARIVTGYQGSDPRPVDGYYVVRQSHAHAWAEYWQAGAGWQRADPTAAVAPDRIQASRSLEPARGLVAGALGSVNPELAAQLRGLGGGEQPLEPVGAELLAQPAVRPAARAGRAFARLA